MSSSERSLSDICAHIVDCPHKTAPQTADEPFAFAVGTKAISEAGAIDWTKCRPVSEETYTTWTARLRPDPGDLIFCREAPVGPVTEVPVSPRVCLGQRTVLLRPDPAIVNPTWLAYALRSPKTQRELQVLAEGSTVSHLNVADIRRFSLRVPPLDEQNGIGRVLSSIDAKIESNQRCADRLAECCGVLYRRLSAEHVGRANGIYDIATVTYGAAFKSALFNDSEGMPLIRVRDVALQRPTVRTPEDHPKTRVVRRGDIVVGMDGEFRAHAWAGPDAVLNQRVCVFDPLPGVSRAFLLEAIKRPLAFFEATKGGTTVIHLGKKDIDTFEIAVPDATVMRNFANTVDPLLSLCVNLRAECRVLEEIRDALLPKLISGAIRIPPNGTSPAVESPEFAISVP